MNVNGLDNNIEGLYSIFKETSQKFTNCFTKEELKGMSAKTLFNHANNCGFFPVAEALRTKNLEDLKRITQLAVPISASRTSSVFANEILNKESNHVTPLIFAIKREDVEFAKELVNKGADVNKHIPLICAAEKGNLNLIEFLVEKGADIHKIEGLGKTALTKAANKGYLNVVKYFTDQGATLNGQTFGSYTALNILVIRNQIKIIEFLLEKNIDIDYQSLTSSVELGRIEILKIFFKKEGRFFWESSEMLELSQTFDKYQITKLIEDELANI